MLHNDFHTVFALHHSDHQELGTLKYGISKGRQRNLMKSSLPGAGRCVVSKKRSSITMLLPKLKIPHGSSVSELTVMSQGSLAHPLGAQVLIYFANVFLKMTFSNTFNV